MSTDYAITNKVYYRSIDRNTNEVTLGDYTVENLTNYMSVEVVKDKRFIDPTMHINNSPYKRVCIIHVDDAKDLEVGDIITTDFLNDGGYTPRLLMVSSITNDLEIVGKDLIEYQSIFSIKSHYEIEQEHKDRVDDIRLDEMDDDIRNNTLGINNRGKVVNSYIIDDIVDSSEFVESNTDLEKAVKIHDWGDRTPSKYSIYKIEKDLVSVRLNATSKLNNTSTFQDYILKFKGDGKVELGDIIHNNKFIDGVDHFKVSYASNEYSEILSALIYGEKVITIRENNNEIGGTELSDNASLNRIKGDEIRMTDANNINGFDSNTKSDIAIMVSTIAGKLEDYIVKDKNIALTPTGLSFYGKSYSGKAEGYIDVKNTEIISNIPVGIIIPTDIKNVNINDTVRDNEGNLLRVEGKEGKRQLRVSSYENNTIKIIQSSQDLLGNQIFHKLLTPFNYDGGINPVLNIPISFYKTFKEGGLDKAISDNYHLLNSKLGDIDYKSILNSREFKMLLPIGLIAYELNKNDINLLNMSMDEIKNGIKGSDIERRHVFTAVLFVGLILYLNKDKIKKQMIKHEIKTKVTKTKEKFFDSLNVIKNKLKLDKFRKGDDTNDKK